MNKRTVKMPNEALSQTNLVYADYKEVGKKELNPKISKLREEETRMVTGTFRCMEPVGGSVSLSYRKYPGEPIRSYTFEDGCTYTIPLGLARHLNSGCAWPVHRHAVDPQTDRPKSEIGKWIHRFSFNSVEYSDPMLIQQG